MCIHIHTYALDLAINLAYFVNTFRVPESSCGKTWLETAGSGKGRSKVLMGFNEGSSKSLGEKQLVPCAFSKKLNWKTTKQ